MIVPSPDGTGIAVFLSGRALREATRERPVLVLVHGASADHTTWRVSGPLLGEQFAVAAVDRRGRGASGDGPDYAIGREYDDIAAVADALATESGAPVAVVGHSYGGRVGLGAALRTASVGRVVCYEGAPPAPGQPYERAAVVERLERLLARGRHEELLVTFLRELVGMSDEQVAAYQANPVWPARVAAAATIPREVAAGASSDAGLEALAAIDTPVLLVLGTASRPAFAAAAEALASRVRDARTEWIDGAAHAAHHTHADAFVAAVARFVADR
jgi:pimeloyl-ACP methyl ester carboxylesterase